MKIKNTNTNLLSVLLKNLEVFINSCGHAWPSPLKAVSFHQIMQPDVVIYGLS